jgi:Indole-3-glycerol phosphate synthase
VKMPREIMGWLKEVINEKMSKNLYINQRRDRNVHSLSKSIIRANSQGRIGVIAEFKRKSPSGLEGLTSIEEFVQFVSEKEVAGISVVTDEKWFQGSYNDLIKVSSTQKPVIMKDFILNEKQIDLAYNLGADAVLIIVKLLTEREVKDLISYAESYNLEAIVEVHDEDELNLALDLDSKIIGVNSRNLTDLSINIDRALELIKVIPKEKVKIFESGIKTIDDADKVAESGANAILVGTAIMKNLSFLNDLINLEFRRK